MKQILVKSFSGAPRGSQSRIADALGVRVQTVNKWSKGHNVPEPQHWRELERLLGLDAGMLTLHGDAGADDVLAGIRSEIAELRARVEVLEAERLTNDEFAMAAHSGELRPVATVMKRREPSEPAKKIKRPHPRPEQGEHIDV